MHTYFIFGISLKTSFHPVTATLVRGFSSDFRLVFVIIRAPGPVPVISEGTTSAAKPEINVCFALAT